MLSSDEISETMLSVGSNGDWSDLPTDVVPDIARRLEMVDFIRFSATSQSFRSDPLIMNSGQKKNQLPWLMCSSRDKPEFRFFHSLTDKKTYKFHLPQIAGQHAVGSSEGFVITINKYGDLHAVNPLTGAQLSPLPPTVTLPGMVEIVRDSDGEIIHYVFDPSIHGILTGFEEVDLLDIRTFYRKAIISPSRDMMIVIQCGACYQTLAFARVGDTSWTALNPLEGQHVYDMIFHKGHLYAVTTLGHLLIVDLNRMEPLINIARNPDVCVRSISASQRRFLVESPDGNDLYLLVKMLDMDSIPRITKTFWVGRWDVVNQHWIEVKEIGDFAVFVGFNYSVAYSTLEYSHVRKNTIYFTYDDAFMYFGEPQCEYEEYEVNGDSGVFNLEDGSIQLLAPVDDLHDSWPPPVWFNPVFK